MPKNSMPNEGDLQRPLNFPIRLDRVSTSEAREFVGVKRMRPGLVYERPTSYGGRLIAVYVGINPKKRSENVWDILYQQAS